MKNIFIIACLVGCFSYSYGQFSSIIKTKPSASFLLKDWSSQKSLLGINHYRGQAGILRYQAPWLSSWPSTSRSNFQPFWLGSTTTQTFGKGKAGTVYYYDMNGNLRNTRNYIDISWRGHRGIRLFISSR